MLIRFWGARGSLPTPGAGTVRYGGDTLCVELRCGPHLLILDGGSGLRGLGAALVDTRINADILLSHTHLDHVCGIPFFRPLYDRHARLRFWGGHVPPPVGIKGALSRGWQAPLMPDLDKEFRADIGFHDFRPGDRLTPRDGVIVDTIMLRHPGGSIGYRINWRGGSLCYITDTEHPSQGVDADLARFVSGADTMIYDASYTDEEYATRKGWGHSTWRAGADLADAARVGRLVLFHHEPTHDDAMMDSIAASIARRRSGSLVAMEGMELTIAPQTSNR
jgi:phosphoribosyl 1,2-cyclic phosphodiesterase